MAKANKPTEAKASGKIVRTQCARDSFRRGGKVHTREAQDFPLEDFSAEQLEQLQDEPLLLVQILDAADSA